MERAYCNAERYHKDHYNPTFYIEERERAILLFLFLFDTFGVLVVEFPAAIHTIPAVISKTFLFTPYFIFLYLGNLTDTGNKDRKNMFANLYCILHCLSDLCMYQGVPAFGTSRTSAWYVLYPTVVRRVP